MVHSAILCLAITATISLAFGERLIQWQCDPIFTTSIYKAFRSEINTNLKVTGYHVPKWTYLPKKYIKCRRRGLVKVPSFLNRDVQLLSLQLNTIRRVVNSDFCHYQFLEAIDLSGNCVRKGFVWYYIQECDGYLTIEKNSFSCLRFLKYLDLSNNKILTMVDHLPESLRILFATSAIVNPIKKHQLAHLRQLEIVRFSANCIEADPKTFCSGNFTIEDHAFDSANLRYMDLGYNGWNSVPNHLFNTGLKGIRLRGNPIKMLKSTDFSNTPALEFLIVAWHTQYSKIPLRLQHRLLDNLYQLRYLDMAGNMLPSLPRGFLQNNPNLEYLNLRFNCFKHLATNPSLLPPLSQLTTLDLSGNTYCDSSLHPVKPSVKELRLGKAFLNFPNLQFLKLGAHKRTTWMAKYLKYGTRYLTVTQKSVDVLRNLRNFSQLNLAACGIQGLDMRALGGIHQLREVNLHTNRIGEKIIFDGSSSSVQHTWQSFHLQKTIFQNNVTVVKQQKAPYTNSPFNLSRNSISDLRHYSFEHCSFATVLDLSHNRISHIYNNTFAAMSRLRELNLMYNPLRTVDAGFMLHLFCLDTIKFRNTAFQYGMNFDFLHGAKIPISFQYKDLYNLPYRLALMYLKFNISFPLVKRLDISGVSVPLYDITRNTPMFSTFPKITELKLRYANLMYPLRSDFFKGISKVVRLDMSYSRLQFFPYLALKRLPNLEYLDFSRNYIQVLNKATLLYLLKLKVLKLSHIVLRHISPSMFTNMLGIHLQHLDLNSNRLKSAGPKVFDKDTLSILKYFDLRGNQLDCHCSLSSNFGWLVRRPREKDKNFPGFLPTCPVSMFIIYSGCVACRVERTTQPLSVLSFSSSFMCHAEFTIKLTISFTASVVSFLLFCVLIHTRRAKWLMAKFANADSRKQYEQTVESKRNKHVESGSRMRARYFSHHGFVFYDLDNQSVGDWVDAFKK